jgi:hypothetical protein
MRKLLLVVLTLCLYPITLAATPRDRDMLLTPTGTVYSVETVENLNVTGNSPLRYLALTLQSGDERQVIPVPETLKGGDHTRPALAYDSDAETLFVFWQKAPSPMATELLFCSYHNGEWSAPTSISGTAAFRFRSNLRVAVTHKFEQIDEKTGEATVVPGVTVHAVWWEDSGLSQSARYAMLSIEKGIVASVAVRDLSDFIAVGPADLRAPNPALSSLLRHPSVQELPSRQQVEVVFGDSISNRIHRATLKPVTDGRVRIPIGVRDTSHSGPRNRVGFESNSARVSILTGADETLAFYAESDDALHYVVYANGDWSSEKSVTLSERISAEAAVEALRKMLAAQ